MAITIQSVRSFVADQQVSENAVDMDLRFSTEDIHEAMKDAARAYNGEPPLISMVNPDALPSDVDCFFYGIAYHLYLRRMLVLQDEDLEYSAGGVTANYAARQLGHIQQMLPRLRDEFYRKIRTIKSTINYRRGYGRVG